MLKANKSPWFEKLFSVYNQNLLRRRFNSFRVFNFNELANRKNDVPLIIYANHSSWWDGLAAHHLSQKARLDFYVMMEEKQLKDLRLFLKLGAFSVVRENPRRAVESINYAANLLKKNPRRALWIFPQGEILPNDTRPIHFYNGLARIIEKTGECETVAVAFRSEFLGNFKPELFAAVGRIERFQPENLKNTKDLTEKFAANMQNTLDDLKSRINNQRTDDFQNLI